MPELAEVDYYRRQWNCGLDQRMVRVQARGEKRIFRGTDVRTLATVLPGSILRGSYSHGKRLLFRFSRTEWLGIHLGMSGKLRVESSDWVPQKHDHLVLYQKDHALVFSDPRLFGRVLFHHGPAKPAWWSDLPRPVLSKKFTAKYVAEFLGRHGKAPVKAVLLSQAAFPGVGNWMADEILWRAGIHPRTLAGALDARSTKRIWRAVRFVSREALRILAKNLDDLPKSWLFRQRWKKHGRCPRDSTELQRDTVGGRTTAWCRRCQPRAMAPTPH